MRHESEPLPFRVRGAAPLPPTGEADGIDVVVLGEAAELRGLVRLAGDRLHLEYRTHVPGLHVTSRARALELPLDAVADAVVEGGWLRPRLCLVVRGLGAVDPLPVDARGRVRLEIARRDRLAARELAAAISLQLAERLGAGGAPPALPPTPRRGP